jgi:integrase/recombinase XerD
MDDKQSLLTQTQLGFIKSLGGRNLSTHTATAYQTDIRQFLTWLTENHMTVDSPAQITRTHILDYLSHLAGSGRSGVTRARKLAAIRELLPYSLLV